MRYSTQQCAFFRNKNLLTLSIILYMQASLLHRKTYANDSSIQPTTPLTPDCRRYCYYRAYPSPPSRLFWQRNLSKKTTTLSRLSRRQEGKICAASRKKVQQKRTRQKMASNGEHVYTRYPRSNQSVDQFNNRVMTTYCLLFNRLLVIMYCNPNNHVDDYLLLLEFRSDESTIQPRRKKHAHPSVRTTPRTKICKKITRQVPNSSRGTRS